jgi:hypothetical protein
MSLVAGNTSAVPFDGPRCLYALIIDARFVPTAQPVDIQEVNLSG